MQLQPGAMLLGGFAAPETPTLLADVHRIGAVTPFRNMVAPGGWPMSVATTNCGSVGWVTDRTRYRYDPLDPETDKLWPAMPRRSDASPSGLRRLPALLGSNPIPAS